MGRSALEPRGCLPAPAPAHPQGCCVLQRCIDYATPGQKAALVAEIARHALSLSQVGLPTWRGTGSSTLLTAPEGAPCLPARALPASRTSTRMPSQCSAATGDVELEARRGPRRGPVRASGCGPDDVSSAWQTSFDLPGSRHEPHCCCARPCPPLLPQCPFGNYVVQARRRTQSQPTSALLLSRVAAQGHCAPLGLCAAPCFARQPRILPLTPSLTPAHRAVRARAGPPGDVLPSGGGAPRQLRHAQHRGKRLA
jgi:hypothetical protein